ncbi:MAG TPA: hypothetical protein VFW75_10785 [Acetobacteraceae bacterium]|nr:hypothetical protein [Acetobacteraceae bacterium]
MDTPVEPGGGGSYDPGVERRLSRLEGEMREVKSVLGQMMPILARIEATLASTLPHLATKAELADKPGKAYLWGVVGVLVAAIVASYGAGLAAIALLR